MTTLPEPSHEFLPEGLPLGEFRVDSFLRAGGMAHVYLGTHPASGARVAIKVLQHHVANVPEYVARFEREGQVMGRLSGCPHIVEVYAADRLPDGRPYLVMEFVRGQDLDDLLIALQSADEKLAIDRTCHLMHGIAVGIAAAHQNHVVHRDLKPPNVMIEQHLDGEEVAKVLDFGVSADLGVVGRAQALTVFGTVIGTPGYMAPEQSVGIQANPSFDIYALGVLLQELLTGDPPPEKGWRAGTPPDVRTLRPETPAALADLIRDATRFDSTQRIQTVEEFIARLDAAKQSFLEQAQQMASWATSRPSSAAGELSAQTVHGTAVPGVSAAAPSPPQSRTQRRSFFRSPWVWLAFCVSMVTLGGLLAFVALTWR